MQNNVSRRFTYQNSRVMLNNIQVCIFIYYSSTLLHYYLHHKSRTLFTIISVKASLSEANYHSNENTRSSAYRLDIIN